jgi:hypothetical protein
MLLLWKHTAVFRCFFNAIYQSHLLLLAFAWKQNIEIVITTTTTTYCNRRWKLHWTKALFSSYISDKQQRSVMFANLNTNFMISFVSKLRLSWFPDTACYVFCPVYTEWWDAVINLCYTDQFNCNFSIFAFSILSVYLNTAQIGLYFSFKQKVFTLQLG